MVGIGNWSGNAVSIYLGVAAHSISVEFVRRVKPVAIAMTPSAKILDQFLC
jgi:hypothetical protein